VTDEDPTRSVQVTRRFAAPPWRVFDAWLDPATAGKWLFATPNGRMTRVEIDPRVGGRFRLTERRGADEADHVGEYVEIDRPKRLVFTFGVPGFPSTLVTVEIAPDGEGSVLTLTHEGVLGEYEARTRDGWRGILEGLSAALG
jgi:uncharacterized protein YndB with AHSA1/START domain